MTDFFDHFDSWEPLFKARKAKGLDKWERLRSLSEKLQGKGVKDITFTCCHPSHSVPTKHLLGSVEGNLHFLLGYGNPDFHMAPYHWQVIDPNLTDREAAEMNSRLSHPANPKLWATVTSVVSDSEGDTEEGNPHPERKAARAKEKAEAENKKGAVVVDSAAGTYVCLPRTQMIYGIHNRHAYSWSLVKDTFFAKMHPEATRAMDSGEMRKSAAAVRYVSSIPEAVKSEAASSYGTKFHEDVWPLVKSRFYNPGKILSLETNEGATFYGVVTDRSVKLYNRDGSSALVKAFDTEYGELDLTKSGSTPPAVLFSFLRKHSDLKEDLLAQASASLTKSKMADNGFSIAEAKKIAKLLKLNLDKEQFTLEDFCDGLNVELEHSDVTKKQARATGKIALAHLRERPDYYKKLKKLEQEPVAKSTAWTVEGEGSEGWDDVPAEIVDFEKAIKKVDGILKVVRA